MRMGISAQILCTVPKCTKKVVTYFFVDLQSHLFAAAFSFFASGKKIGGGYVFACLLFVNYQHTNKIVHRFR